MIKLIIDGREVTAKEGATIFEAALDNGIYIPNLCCHPDLPPIGACRLCIVEIEGVKGFPTACTTPAKQGMSVKTNTPGILKRRKNILWLILSEYPSKPCDGSQLKKVADWIGAEELLPEFERRLKNLPVVTGDPLFIRDQNKCILCGRCIRICMEVRGVGAIGFINRGINTTIGTSYGLPLKDANCRFCGACVEVCPSGALIDKKTFNETERDKILVPCRNTCPARIDAAQYVRLIAEEKFQDALEVIREKVPFPGVLGYVCTHPCEDACRRGEVNEPVSIRDLKRFVFEKDTGRWKSKLKIKPDTGKKVAVVGSGPAGLTCAWFLRLLGHSVTVFEALNEPGGMMRTGIPKYRLPRKVLDREIKDIENTGVRIKMNARIESPEELFAQGYNAVFLASGASKTSKLGIPGDNDPRVLDGISLLASINRGERIYLGKKIAVIGGGNVAIDAARSARRMGVKEVTVLYRRTRDELPAMPEELEEALKEGVKFEFLVMPKRIIIGSDKLKIECLKCILCEPGPDGRRKPAPVEGSEFILEADRLITAIGQKPSIPKGFEGRHSPAKGIFAGGDAVTGPSTVIEAIQSGREAAISIDKYLGGKGLIEIKLVDLGKENPCIGMEESFAHKKRNKMPGSGFNKKTALKEAGRCLRCQLRLTISKTT